jgi:hypothetical protein
MRAYWMAAGLLIWFASSALLWVIQSLIIVTLRSVMPPWFLLQVNAVLGGLLPWLFLIILFQQFGAGRFVHVTNWLKRRHDKPMALFTDLAAFAVLLMAMRVAGWWIFFGLLLGTVPSNADFTRILLFYLDIGIPLTCLAVFALHPLTRRIRQ